MPNIRKRPTETITIRVPKTYLKFFKTLENRNKYFLELIENSDEYKNHLLELKKDDDKKYVKPSIFE